MGQCWPLRMPPTPKSVLISLADNANDHGVCWPSLPRIAARTCLGRTAIIEAITWLEEHGVLTVQRAASRSNRYMLTPENFRIDPEQPARPEPVDEGVNSTAGERSATRTVHETDGPPNGPEQSATRTVTVRQADPNRNRTIKNQKTSSPARAEDAEPDKPLAPATALAVGLRKAGFLDVLSMNPTVIEAAAEGVTVEACLEFAETRPDVRSGLYLIAAVRGIRAEPPKAAKPRAGPASESRTMSGMKSLDDVQLTDGRPTLRRRTDDRAQDGPTSPALPGP